MNQHPNTKKLRVLGAAEALLNAIESPDGGDARVTALVGASDRTGPYTITEFIDAMTLLLREGVTSAEPGADDPGPSEHEHNDSLSHSRRMRETGLDSDSCRLRLETVRKRIRRRADILQRCERRREEVNQPNDQGRQSQPSVSHHSAFTH